ncbi:MAG: helix-turn-helix transcriptional regulator [Phycisphaerae bacterium]|nr:helix-turn-helix transcriptional regulator [Saprospiraceae bacterium]
MKNSIIERIRARTQPETRIYIQKNLDIAFRVNELLQQKGWTQKDLAKALDKSESEVSRWLSGLHNLTLKSIVKLEAVLGAEIMAVASTTTSRATIGKATYPDVLQKNKSLAVVAEPISESK